MFGGVLKFKIKQLTVTIKSTTNIFTCITTATGLIGSTSFL